MMKVPPLTGLARNSRIDRVSRVMPYAYYPYLNDDAESYRDGGFDGNGYGWPQHRVQTLKYAVQLAAAWLEESRQLSKAASAIRNQNSLVPGAPGSGTLFDSEAAIKTLILHMNHLNAAFEAGAGVLDPSLKFVVSHALRSTRYERIGLSELADGAWTLQEKAFQAALEARPDDVRSLIASRTTGIAASLVHALDQYLEWPVSRLLNLMAPGFEALTAYGSSMEPYMQLQPSGLVVNHRG
ncbi:hypothetical protein [Paenibacillus mendelii]|uniref:EcxA zinc-binding domain-containing protein n=1 Tax=Paenibacillus mendelii TaxID=206163 RepID=A0ABV6JKQ5_9BACL|nr:hypothetical protein [Paenibacillus mendelii]MCQ6559204.1 hypothetical protein [Paenibacillus mendelii]